MTDWPTLLIIGLIGLSVGSFLNVLVDRLSSGQSLVSPPSHCPECQTRLRPWDLIPIVSYLVLRGRCRYCQARIPARTFAVELTAGLLYALIWVHYGPGFQAIAMMAYASLLLTVFVIDLEQQIIPNRIVVPGFVGFMVLASFWPGLGPAQAAIGAGAGFGMLLLLYLVPSAVIGAGDVKFAAVVGAATGFPLVIFSLGLTFVLGGSIGAVLLVTRKMHRRARMPFGPFIAVSALLTLVWGEPWLDWYLTRFWPL